MNKFVLHRTYKVDKIRRTKTPVFFTSVTATHTFQLKQYKETGYWGDSDPIEVPLNKKGICKLLNDLNK